MRGGFAILFVWSICLTAWSTAARAADGQHVNFGVGLMEGLGTSTEVGIDPGLGGQPSRAFERPQPYGLHAVAMLSFHFSGLVPKDNWTSQNWCTKLFVSGVIPLGSAVTGVGAAAGAEVMPWLDVFVGSFLWQRQEHLRAPLMNGDIFAAPSSQLPTEQTWGRPGGRVPLIFGATINIELLRMAFE